MEYNKDIDPDESEDGPYGKIIHFVKSPSLKAYFDAKEKASSRNKAIYQLGSLIAYALIGVGITASSYLVLVNTQTPPPNILKAMTLSTLFGSAIQLFLWMGRFKMNWLLARYAAERVRSVKAQLIAEAAFHPSEELTPETAENFVALQLTNIAHALNSGIPALSLTDPKELVQINKNAVDTYAHYPLVLSAYQTYRVKFQRNFALGEKGRLQTNVEEYKGLGTAMILLLAITAAALTSISFLGVGEQLGVSQEEFLFASVTLFTISALLTAKQRTSLSEPNLGRYHRYHEDVERLVSESPETASAFRDYVFRMERLAIDELKEFTDDAKLLGARLF